MMTMKRMRRAEEKNAKRYHVYKITQPKWTPYGDKAVAPTRCSSLVVLRAQLPARHVPVLSAWQRVV